MANRHRGRFRVMTVLAAGLLFLTVFPACSSWDSGTDADGQRNDYYLSNKPPLVAQPYTELPIGAIKPKGWLLEQLRIQRAGLTGNLDQVYSKVVGPDNGWLGGDGDGWERGPYWLDGLVPLAYILEDESLQQKAQEWIEWSINNQREDGYFGPRPFEKEPEPVRGVQRGRRMDWWPKMVMLKVLKQYYMATEDDRVLELMTGYFRYQLEHLPEQPLDHWSYWGNRRGGDNLKMVYWLYNRTEDPFLLELGRLIHSQTHDWTGVMSGGEIASVNPLPDIHTVNMAQGLKEPVIYYQQDPSPRYIEAVKQGLRDLKQVHGFVNGLYGGDENLHGNAPTQGSELCTAVEFMYSMESMIPITGEIDFADHLEKIAFNVLPTQHNDSFDRRQYFQQPNQVLLTDVTRNFFQDNVARICYGVLSGYPCCTTNMHQGWPKLVQNLWYATADNGLAAMIYSSSVVTAMVGSEGDEVTITEETGYPFEETIRFTVNTSTPVEFPLELRIPGWSERATVSLNGEPWREVANGGQMLEIDRTWSDGDEVELRLPMPVRVSRWAEQSAGIERGPLVFALKIGERWEEVRPDPDQWRLQNSFYEVFPTDPWNYGITKQSIDSLAFTLQRRVIDAVYPWNLENVPIQLTTEGKRIDSWTLYRGSAGPLPVSPVDGYQDLEPEQITLVPYGSTTLRIAQFPVVR